MLKMKKNLSCPINRMKKMVCKTTLSKQTIKLDKIQMLHDHQQVFST